MTETFHAPFLAAGPAPHTRSGHWHVWLIAIVSLGGHAALFGLLSFSVPPAIQSVEIISARLFSPPAPIRTRQHTPSPPATSKPANNTAVETPDAVPSDNINRNTASHDATAPAPDKNEENALPQQRQRATSPSPTLSSRAAMERFIASQHQQAIRQDGTRAASAFRRQQRAPDLTDPRKARIEDELATGPPPKRINCSSNINKVMVTLSRSAGGTLRCSELADFAPYVEKRLKAHTGQ